MIPKNLIPPREPRTPITEEEFWPLYKILRRPERGRKSRSLFRVCLWFLFDTGARTCEAWTGARWENLSWEHGAVIIWRHKTARKVSKPRILVFGGKTARLLLFLWRRQGSPKEGPIFLNARGRPWVSPRFGSHFRRYAALAGLPNAVSAYSLRHGFVCGPLYRGLGHKQVADLSGQTTTRYVDTV